MHRSSTAFPVKLPIGLAMGDEAGDTSLVAARSEIHTAIALVCAGFRTDDNFIDIHIIWLRDSV
jgi:hypothetical protein